MRHIDSTPKDVLLQEEDVQARSISPPGQRLDGKQDRWAPRYLCAAQPLVPLTPYAKDFKVKLSDIGDGQFPPFPSSLSSSSWMLYMLIPAYARTAYLFTDPPTKPVTPLGLRAPEFILSGTVDNTLDV